MIKYKHEQVKEEILANIRKGEYTSDDSLPGERLLAKSFGVSYMTARRAVTELVAENLLERQENKGIFLKPDCIERLSTETLNLMCTSYEAPVVHKFIQTGEKEAKSRGWNINIIRIHDNETNLVNKIIKSGNKCIFLWDNLDSSVISIMQAYNEQIVLIGADMSALGIRSVFINLSLTASLLIDTLKKNGHNKVALILHNPGHHLDQQIIQCWQDAFKNKTIGKSDHLIISKVSPYESAIEPTYNDVKAYLKSNRNKVTAFICISHETTLGAMAACRDAGLSIPEDISFINYGDCSTMAFAYPPVTCVDLNMSEQVSTAFKMLDGKIKDNLRLVKPTFFERKSIRVI